MNDKLLIVLLIILPMGALAQNTDSLNLLFKAKLLTVSPFGIAPPDSILHDIKKQKAVFLSSPSKNLYLIKVIFDQTNFGGSILLGECNYYLAFNEYSNRFYKLGGFKDLHLTSFFEDLTTHDYQIFNLSYLSTSEIDFLCLSDYNNLSVRKKRKRKFDCLLDCTEKLSTRVIVH